LAIHDLGRFVENLGVSEVVLALQERRNSLPLKDLLRMRAVQRNWPFRRRSEMWRR
jgi:hypothetical protein